ncbi:conserved hypothetical protein [Vibrio vulnificus YJ016]|uniref:Uncharacterized protein n=1 Tax=Vibrio vulnificus (strain YJ016) TaxID=196600 RepID=Q7MQ27_VIBVY|nr:hypothetical protein FORC9_2727 [Vibrio vulnificus]BAC92947.1 conserved hypothetical protein [Vibrio vulnificus YJ016]
MISATKIITKVRSYMCNHSIHLQRHHRSFWQKIIGIKEIYICQNCGHTIKVR